MELATTEKRKTQQKKKKTEGTRTGKQSDQTVRENNNGRGGRKKNGFLVLSRNRRKPGQGVQGGRRQCLENIKGGAEEQRNSLKKKTRVGENKRMGH